MPSGMLMAVYIFGSASLGCCMAAATCYAASTLHVRTGAALWEWWSRKYRLIVPMSLLTRRGRRYRRVAHALAAATLGCGVTAVFFFYK